MKTTTELFSNTKPGELISWKVKVGGYVRKGHVIFDYAENDTTGKKSTFKYKSSQAGIVTQLLVRKGDSIAPGTSLLNLEECSHPTVITDLCAVCGIDFRQFEDGNKPVDAKVSMIHTVPDLKCSMKEAQEISKTEEVRLLKQRKLHLLVDLDQTLIHTTNMEVPAFVNDVFRFRLPGSPLFYHTRLRPGTRPFLEKISKLYELHICTFGSRNYAHSIARHLDPDGKLFYIRILSRDECFNPNSKTANLQDLFPSGDHMVCIIDDREDVWNFTPSLIHVKPYHFFSKTGDINAPPDLAKKEDDNKVGFDFSGGSVKQLSNITEPLQEPTKVLEEKAPDNNTPPMPTEQIEIKELSDDLLLSDESDTSTEADKERDTDSSSSSEQTEVSTPKPDVPHVFEEDSNSTAPVSKEDEVHANENGNSEPTESNECTEQHDGEKTVPVENMVAASDPGKAAVDIVVAPEKGTVKATESSPKSEQFSEDEKQYLLPDSDDYLMYLEDILLRIHSTFYKEYDVLQADGNTQLPNVKNVIPRLRKTVLKGCNIVFSGIVPVGAKVEMSRAYGVATSMGATVTERFIPPRKPGQPSSSKDIPATTHVVAARMGTAKTNDARRYKGVHIVTPDWLWSCAERWDHVDERLYTLCKKSTVRRNPPAYLSTEKDSNSEGGSSRHSENDEAFLGDTAVQDGENGVLPTGSRRIRTLSGRFMDTINPLLSFSTAEIADMDHEVDDICGLSESSSDDEPPAPPPQRILRRNSSRNSTTDHQPISYVPNDINSSSNDSSDDEDSVEIIRALKRKRDLPPTEEEPEEEESLVTKFRRGEPLPSDVEMLNLTNQTSDDDNDGPFDHENEWMARQLEAELLGTGDSSQDIL